MNTLPSTDAAAMRIDWAAWIEEYSPLFLLYARQQCRNESAAEVVLLDALVQLVREVEAGSFTGTQNQWRVYVFNAIHRMARTRRPLVDLSRNDEVPWLSGEYDSEYLRARVESAFLKLSPEKAEVVVLHIWGELTFQEIAEVTDNKLSTIASRYRYALRDMREELEANPIER